MKKLIVLAAVFSLILLSCQSSPKGAAAKSAKPGAAVDDVSYAFGLLIGDNLKSTKVTIDMDSFTLGMEDALKVREARMTLEAADALANDSIGKARTASFQVNKEAEAKFLAENKTKPGVQSTASGLQYKVIEAGQGAKPAASDTITVDYVGTYLDGRVFDSSVARGQPLVIQLNRVIPGWTEGLQLMNVGSKYILYVPSSLAYGEQGAGEEIAPFTTLVFEVSLLGIGAPEGAADEDSLEDLSGN